MKSDRNILVQSIAYEILNTTLLQPSQEIKQITQQYLEAKQRKIGPIILKQYERKNPYISRGLYVTDQVRTHTKSSIGSEETKGRR